jgi:phage terminase large subunit
MKVAGEVVMAKTSFKQRATAATQQKTKDIHVTYKQGLFIYCTADEVLWGGAAGPGKTFGQLIDALYCADKYAGIKQLILRETFPELSRSLIMESLKMYPPDRMQYNAAEHKWYHINGSMIEFGYLDSDAGVQIYQSAEYDIIRIDESTHMSEFRITYMKSRIRGANDFPKQLKMTTNPGGLSHKFHKKRFKIGINAPCETFTEYIGEDEKGNKQYETRCFIPARVYDNEFLMKANPGYIKSLMQLPEKERKALLEGSWDIFDDQAFPEFDYNIHVVNSQKLFPQGIPAHWKRWLAVDNGYDDPFAWYWFTVSEQGKVYLYREFTREKGDKATMIKYSAQAEKVLEKSTYTDDTGQERVEKFTFKVAGHDAFATHVRDEIGKTIIDHYQDGGLYGFIPGIKDRKFRKATMHEYLDPYKDENTGLMTAKLQIFDTCKVIIEKLPEMLKDPDDNEKVLDVDDHPYDGVSYGVCAYHASKSKALTPEKNKMQLHKEKMWKQFKQRDRRH